MFIPKLLRQRHFAGGVGELESLAVGQRADAGEDGLGR
jgi:hypothetical protein